jgi:hypothetical protein
MAVGDASVYQLGVARKVTISDKKTTIISDNATREEIQARVAQLKRDMAETTSTREAQLLAQRIAKLSGGVAVIKVYCSHTFFLLTQLLKTWVVFSTSFFCYHYSQSDHCLRQFRKSIMR